MTTKTRASKSKATVELMTAPEVEVIDVEASMAEATATTEEVIEVVTTEAKKAKRDRSFKSSVPTKDRRLMLMSLLRKLKATSAKTAQAVNDLAEALGFTSYDVYVLAYHTQPLAKQELVKMFRDEDRSVKIYLTTKGRKSDPE